MSFFILLSLNVIFGIFLFVYFKDRFQKLAKSEELRKEVGSLISVFNQTADRHITQLEDLIQRADETSRALSQQLAKFSEYQPQKVYPSDDKSPSFSTTKIELPDRHAERVETMKKAIPDKDDNPKKRADHSPKKIVREKTKKSSKSSPDSLNLSFKVLNDEEMIVSEDFFLEKENPYKSAKTSNLQKMLDEKEALVLKTLSLPKKIKYLAEKNESENSIAEKCGVSLTEIRMVLSRPS